MDIEPDADLERFRAEVAEFLDAAPTDEIREAGRKTTSVFAPFDETMAWQKTLHARGWAAPDWPVEHGGTGWSVEQRYVYAEEYQRRGLPPLLPNALRMIGPLLMELGTPEQQARYLPRILAAEDYWTQGYSEPDAGSDLASLSCSAVPDGDDYVINGTKIWTTWRTAPTGCSPWTRCSVPPTTTCGWSAPDSVRGAGSATPSTGPCG